MIYAGIGSRTTPGPILDKMEEYSKYLYKLGWSLRSGGAKGADTYFAKGTSFDCEILTPKNFTIPMKAFEIAHEHHPAWDACSMYAKQLLARNVCILLGQNIDSPVDVVLYWRPEHISYGGTLHAVTIAKANDIPCFNVATIDDIETWATDFTKSD